MPAKFESGVSAYTHAVYLAEVYFPITDSGKEIANCEECFYYRVASRSCGLNKEVCTFPEKYVGAHCPLFRVDDNQYFDLQDLITKIMEENDK